MFPSILSNSPSPPTLALCKFSEVSLGRPQHWCQMDPRGLWLFLSGFSFFFCEMRMVIRVGKIHWGSAVGVAQSQH